MSEVLIEVRDVRKTFPVKGGIFQRKVAEVRAVDNVSLDIFHGEALGLVGESGCGKSTLGRIILKLLEPDEGRVVFDGTDITASEQKDLRTIRREMQVIFQDPLSSLDPRATIGQSIQEGMRVHGVPKEERHGRVGQVLELVGLEPYHAQRYPHEFSGGQRQRIGIARALALGPRFLVCDEPVSALDVSIQSQILNLLKQLQQELDLTLLFIAHDLSVVEHLCDRIAVMYLGRVVEVAERDRLFEDTLHPYTQGLLSAIPIPDPERDREQFVLQGEIPSPINPPSGCTFHPRCPIAQEGICDVDVPELLASTDDESHLASCHLRTGAHQHLDPEVASSK